MKKVNYAYDTLYYETQENDHYSFSIRIKEYRLKSRYPLIVANVSRMPIINDFSVLPDNYDELCESVEVRLKSSLSLIDMIQQARKLLRDRFLQDYLAFN